MTSEVCLDGNQIEAVQGLWLILQSDACGVPGDRLWESGKQPVAVAVAIMLRSQLYV